MTIDLNASAEEIASADENDLRALVVKEPWLATRRLLDIAFSQVQTRVWAKSLDTRATHAFEWWATYRVVLGGRYASSSGTDILEAHRVATHAADRAHESLSNKPPPTLSEELLEVCDAMAVLCAGAPKYAGDVLETGDPARARRLAEKWKRLREQLA